MAAFDRVWPSADVTVVELGDPATSDDVLGQLLERVDPARDLVMVVAPSAPGDAAELTAFAIAGPGIDPGRARSATTRRDGYVTLPDVGVTVLDALGIDVPDTMNGTEITSGGGPAFGPGTADDLADANTIAVFRDRTVGPVSVMFVALQIVTYLVAVLLLVRGRRRGSGAVLFVGARHRGHAGRHLPRRAWCATTGSGWPATPLAVVAASVVARARRRHGAAVAPGGARPRAGRR